MPPWHGHIPTTTIKHWMFAAITRGANSIAQIAAEHTTLLHVLHGATICIFSLFCQEFEVVSVSAPDSTPSFSSILWKCFGQWWWILPAILIVLAYLCASTTDDNSRSRCKACLAICLAATWVTVCMQYYHAVTDRERMLRCSDGRLLTDSRIIRVTAKKTLLEQCITRTKNACSIPENIGSSHWMNAIHTKSRIQALCTADKGYISYIAKMRMLDAGARDASELAIFVVWKDLLIPFRSMYNAVRDFCTEWEAAVVMGTPILGISAMAWSLTATLGIFTMISNMLYPRLVTYMIEFDWKMERTFRPMLWNGFCMWAFKFAMAMVLAGFCCCIFRRAFCSGDEWHKLLVRNAIFVMLVCLTNVSSLAEPFAYLFFECFLYSQETDDKLVEATQHMTTSFFKRVCHALWACCGKAEKTMVDVGAYRQHVQALAKEKREETAQNDRQEEQSEPAEVPSAAAGPLRTRVTGRTVIVPNTNTDAGDARKGGQAHKGSKRENVRSLRDFGRAVASSVERRSRSAPRKRAVSRSTPSPRNKMQRTH